MRHGVDGQRQPRLAHVLGGATLFDLRASTVGDAVAHGHLAVLDAELHMFEASLFQCHHRRVRSRPMPEVIRLP